MKLLERINGKGVMNRMWHLFSMAVAIMMSLGLTACGDDEPEPGPSPDMMWDFAPFDIDIMIVDENGENLLNPEVEGNWMDAPFKIVYKNKDYDTNWVDFISPEYWSESLHNSRTCLAFFSGLKCVEYTYWNGDSWTWHENEYLLAFGEFQAEDNHDLKIELFVPGEDTPYKISVEHRFAWTGVDETEIYTRIWVNGKEAQSPIKIVLPRRENVPAE